jgi:hypothetical protein
LRERGERERDERQGKSKRKAEISMREETSVNFDSTILSNNVALGLIMRSPKLLDP